MQLGVRSAHLLRTILNGSDLRINALGAILLVCHVCDHLSLRSAHLLRNFLNGGELWIDPIGAVVLLRHWAPVVCT